MADKKISQLTTLAQADVAVTADFLPIVDTSATETKKATPQALVQAGATGATLPVALGAVTTPSYTFTGDLNTGMWSPAADTVALSTGGSERLRVDSSGNAGIGTASPGSRLEISASNPFFTIYNTNTGDNGITWESDAATGASRASLFLNYTNAELRMTAGVGGGSYFQSFYTNGSERARFTAGGYFKASNDGTYANSTAAYHELRTSAADYSVITSNSNASPYGAYFWFSAADPNNATNLFLLCNGWNGSANVTRATIRSNGGLANYQANDVNLSDERVKTDIAPLGSMWDKIKALEIVTFKYKDQTHDDDNIGLIAQQVEAVAPEFVDADGFGKTPEDGVPLKTIYTADMYHAAIKALQEAMARIETLEAKVTALDNK